MSPVELTKREHLRRALYQFRMRHGVPADLYSLAVGSPNFETGVPGVTRTKISLPQFITGSVDLLRKFQYSISSVKANSNFSYGGFFEVGDRFGIVDGTYLNGYQIQQKDYFVYQGKRYDIQKLVALDANSGYLVHIRHVEGSKPYQILDVTIVQTIPVTDEVTGVI